MISCDKKNHNKVLTSKEKITYKILNFSSYFLAAISFFSLFEIDEMDNNFGGTKLFIVFALIGFLLFLIAFFKIINKYKIVLDKTKNMKLQLGASLFVSMIFGFPSLANYYNRINSSGEENCDNYVIVRKSESVGKTHSYFLFFKINKNEERISIKEDFWKEFREGEKVELCIEKGGLGFYFLKKINNRKI
jgi:glucan phosphoethanolaminetransferase (alkaline phosphatase superfamily)